jgi:hypothetical protein
MKNKSILAFVFVAILLAGAYLAKQKYDSALQATSEGLRLGQAYGAMISQSNCTLGLRLKYTECTTTDCELSANGYIAGCMEKATRDNFCDSVPAAKNTDLALNWASNTCSTLKLGNDRCPKYIHKFVNVCTEQSQGRPLSTQELMENGFNKGLNK